MPVEVKDEKGHKHRTTQNRDNKLGIAQGSPISPLFSNLYMVVQNDCIPHRYQIHFLVF